MERSINFFSTIRCTTAALLSDTSENEVSDNRDLVGHDNVDDIVKELNHGIKLYVSKKKTNRTNGIFLKELVVQHEEITVKNNDKLEHGRFVNKTPTLNNSVHITPITFLKLKSQLSDQQIDKFAKEKNAIDKLGQQKWLMESELEKLFKHLTNLFFYLKGIHPLQRTKSRNIFIELYHSEIYCIDENMKSFLVKFAQSMCQLNVMLQSKFYSAKNLQELDISHKASSYVQRAPETIVADNGNLIKIYFLSQLEMNLYEEVLSRNIFFLPGIENINQILLSKNVFPEEKTDIIRLDNGLAEVEKELKETTILGNYITRIVYFFTYKNDYNSTFVKNEFKHIVSSLKVGEEPKERISKGCLLIYENVNMCIVMVEGQDLDILTHLINFKRSQLLSILKRGKILYIHNLLLKMYFNKWVVRLETPTVRKIHYLVKRKKIISRTAASIVVQLSKMLHKVYTQISREECLLIDPKSVYTKAKYIILLPSPAIFAYLLKNKVLRNIGGYLDKLGMHQDLIAEIIEQPITILEDIYLTKYVDNGNNKKEGVIQFLKDMMERPLVNKKAKGVNDLKSKIDSWDRYYIDEHSPSIIDDRIITFEDKINPGVKLLQAIDDYHLEENDKKEEANTNTFTSVNNTKINLLKFLEKGTDTWSKKLMSYDEYLKRELNRNFTGSSSE